MTKDPTMTDMDKNIKQITINKWGEEEVQEAILRQPESHRGEREAHEEIQLSNAKLGEMIGMLKNLERNTSKKDKILQPQKLTVKNKTSILELLTKKTGTNFLNS